MDFNGILGISDIISIIGIAIPVVMAVVGGIYKVMTDTKEYELTEQYKRELLTWYGKTLYILSELIHLVEAGVSTAMESELSKDKEPKEPKREKLLSNLSAQIEIGRFYFPNVDKGDDFGKEKPLAYQGYRHYALDLLQWIYVEIKYEDHPSLKNIETWMREFTSIVYQVVDPKKRLKHLEKYTDIVKPETVSREDKVK